MSYKQILTTNDIGIGANQVAAGNHNHDSLYVKKSGDTMTGLLKTNGSIENQGEAKFTHPDYCPDIEDTAENIGCAFKASRGHFNQMNVNEIYLPATTTTNYEGNKVSFKTYSGGNNGAYTNVSEVAQINTAGLKVGSSSISTNGYIEGTWLRTTAAGNKAGDFATIDSSGWIYKRTAAQVLSDIGAASSSHNHDTTYVKKTGDTMSGNLITSRSDSNDAYFRATNSKGSIGLLSSTDRGLYDYTKSKWLIYTDGTKASTSYALYGAVWNDYAEFREGDTIDAGRCVVEVGDDTLITSTKRMMPGANITSDTFGFAIGETKWAKTPIAVSGRVLAYPYESREEFKKNIGRPVCSGPNGTISIMTDEEYRNKGYCAIGTISAVPDYEEWGTGKVKVNGRVWIKVF